jgi:hypothetical protein
MPRLTGPRRQAIGEDIRPSTEDLVVDAFSESQALRAAAGSISFGKNGRTAKPWSNRSAGGALPGDGTRATPISAPRVRTASMSCGGT